MEELADLNFILQQGTAPPYIPIVPITLLKSDLIYLLKHSNRISGLILYKANETIEQFSHEVTCPNSNSNLPNTCSKNWNKYGTGLLQEDIPFPVFYMDNYEDITSVKNCFNKFNNFSYESHNVRALCSIELSSFMFATINTPTCIRHVAINS